MTREAEGKRELAPVGKAYFGFTDEELRWLDKWVRDHTTNRFGPVREVTRTGAGDRLRVPSGKFTFLIGDKVPVGGLGSCAFMPVTVSHTWKSIGALPTLSITAL